MNDYITDRGARSNSLRGTIKKSIDSSKPTSPRKRSDKEGEKITQVSGFLGLPDEKNRTVTLSPKIKQDKDIPEGSSYLLKDPDKPIELIAGETKGETRANEQHWGYHLIVNIAEGNKNIESHDAVAKFLSDMVVELKMRAIGNPIVLDVTGQEGRGVTGIQLLTTSHVSIHTDDDKETAYIDVFSCAPYDHKVALKHIQKTFEPKKISYAWLFRDSGDWPRK